MTKLAALLPVFLIITGCVKEEETPWTRLQKAAASTPSIATNSPDATVKSWWNVLDTKSELAFSTCKEMRPLYGIADTVKKDLFVASESRAKSDDDVCRKQTYRREISKVDIQSDTRALVYATVQNSVPPTPGYVMDADDKRRKEQGLSLRYLLERSGADKPWKIAQLYAQESYCSRAKVDGWCAVYGDNSGTANAFVFAATQ